MQKNFQRSVTALGVLLAFAALPGCRPDQEYRLAEACRTGVNYIIAPQGKDSCACLAKAAVAQLDGKVVEDMIRMFEGDQTMVASLTTDDAGSMMKIMDFSMKNAACFE